VNAIRKEELPQFRADIYSRWKRGMDTCAIARELNVSELFVARELRRIMDVRFAVNSLCGND
jgi:IS30 family transposase